MPEYNFPNKKYKTILIDPPYPEFGGGKIKRGADRHYTLMSIAEIKALPVRSLADTNCHLYLWVTNNYLQDGLDIMQIYGFTYKTKIEWIKGDPNTHQFNNFGLGQYFRGITETCLFGVKGVLPYKEQDGKRCQGRTAFFAQRREHSEKPEEMRKMIELVSYEPYIELFARKPVQGWTTWGNEVDKGMIDLNLFDHVDGDKVEPQGDIQSTEHCDQVPLI